MGGYDPANAVVNRELLRNREIGRVKEEEVNNTALLVNNMDTIEISKKEYKKLISDAALLKVYKKKHGKI
jgi:hypothetical protein